MKRRKFIRINRNMAIGGMLLPRSFTLKSLKNMHTNSDFEVIIIGGNYAGLSAALALGRAMRKTLVIDSGQPCNRQTPHSHNFLTQDGNKPSEIARLAREQVVAYPTVSFKNSTATEGQKTDEGILITTREGERFVCRKLLVASGVVDQMPAIRGFADCWGVSVLHCPYCHGYEFKGMPTGILANGDTAMEMSQLIRHWTPSLNVFTNGSSTLDAAQIAEIKGHGISIIEDRVVAVEHLNGQMSGLSLENGAFVPLNAIYTRLPFHQHCQIPAQLGCEHTKTGHIQVDMFQKTGISGVFAAGDATSPFRSISHAVSAGSIAGAVINRELIVEAW